MWIQRLWIEFPKCCAPNGKYIKIMILLIGGALGVESWSFESICFFLYTHHCLCACETDVQKHWLWWCGPSDGPEVQPDGRNSGCSFNWIFWNSWKCRRKKWGWLQGMEVYCTPESFVSFFKWFLPRYYFHLPTSIKGLR